MKTDVEYEKNIPKIIRFFILLTFVCFNNSLYSQNQTDKKPISRISTDSIFKIRNITLPFLSETFNNLSGSLLPAAVLTNDPPPIFYDSLQAKASRKLIKRGSVPCASSARRMSRRTILYIINRAYSSCSTKSGRLLRKVVGDCPLSVAH